MSVRSALHAQAEKVNKEPLSLIRRCAGLVSAKKAWPIRKIWKAKCPALPGIHYITSVKMLRRVPLAASFAFDQAKTIKTVDKLHAVWYNISNISDKYVSRGCLTDQPPLFRKNSE